MNFSWIDYKEFSNTTNDFFDSEAMKQTDLDDFDSYLSYWTSDGGAVYNEDFFCKVAFERDTPIGVVVLGKDRDGMFTFSAVVVAPVRRKKGYGTAILREILTKSSAIIGCKITHARAVIFPGNAASIRAFEKAGFRLIGQHPDGDVLYYEYTKKD